MPAQEGGDGIRINWKENARKIHDAFESDGAYCYLGAEKLTVVDAGFSHEPSNGPPGEVMRVTTLGVEVATGAGLIVLRTVGLGETSMSAEEFLKRAGLGEGAILT